MGLWLLFDPLDTGYTALADIVPRDDVVLLLKGGDVPKVDLCGTEMSETASFRV